MGLISMSERDVKRPQVLAAVRAGKQTVMSVPAVLEMVTSVEYPVSLLRLN
jgi:hypothetical protein